MEVPININISDNTSSIYGFTNTKNFTGIFKQCKIHVSAPIRKQIKAWAEFDINNLIRCQEKSVISFRGYPRGLDLASLRCENVILYNYTLPCHYSRTYAKSPLIITNKNMLIITVTSDTIPTNFWTILHIGEYTREEKLYFNKSSIHGYITSPGFKQNVYYPLGLAYEYHFHPPDSHSFMISFQYVEIGHFLSMHFRPTEILREKVLWYRSNADAVDTRLYSVA